MTSLVWDAEKYAIDTQIDTLGWSSTFFRVRDLGATGRKVWRSGSAGASPVYEAGVTDYELLLVKNFTHNEDPTLDYFFHGSVLKEGIYDDYKYIVNRTVAGATSTTVSMFGTTQTAKTDIASIDPNLATAVRIQIKAGGLIKARIWQAAVNGLEAAEPSTWNYEGTKSAPPAYATQVHFKSSGGSYIGSYSSISLGTAGDPALFALPEQTVATPTGLTATPTSDGALLDWV